MREYLCNSVLNNINREQHPVYWALFNIELGLSYLGEHNCEPNEERKLALGIEAEKVICEGLDALHKTSNENLWAQENVKLAALYADRAFTDKPQDIEKCIKCLLQSDNILTEDNAGDFIAVVKQHLGKSFLRREYGDRSSNLEKAISYLEDALELCWKYNLSAERADTSYYLSMAYNDRVEGDPFKNLDRAAAFLKQTLDADRNIIGNEMWATAHQNLGSIFLNMIGPDQNRILKEAIEHFQYASEFFTKERYPSEYANILYGYSHALFDMNDEDPKERYEKCIVYLTEALHLFRITGMNDMWAECNNLLGSVYLERMMGVSKENREKSKQHFSAAINYYRSTDPRKLTRALTNYAHSLDDLMDPNVENQAEAIRIYQSAIEQATNDKDKAISWMSLASILARFMGGRRSENVKESITYYEKALRYFTSIGDEDTCVKDPREYRPGLPGVHT